MPVKPAAAGARDPSLQKDVTKISSLAFLFTAFSQPMFIGRHPVFTANGLFRTQDTNSGFSKTVRDVNAE
jgi:hypothetical protein